MDDSNTHANPPLAGPVHPPEADEDILSSAHNGSITTEDVEASPPSLQKTSAILTLQSLTDRALDFLGHASNEALGACFVGLGVSTYLLLGRVGLLAIGIAGGVVLHATWEGVRLDDRDEATKAAEQARRREANIEVVRRVLDWRSSRASLEETARDSKVLTNQSLDYSDFGPETSTALKTFTDAVISNYVHWWYDPVIPDEHSFPASCRRTFTAFVLSLSAHLQRKRSADVFLDFVANASSIVIVFLTELAAALNASPNAPAEEAIATYLKLKPESSLAYMLDQGSQKSKLAEAAEDILQAYLDPKAYNCQPVHAFLREVLAQIVLGYSVASCSRPEWINDWIVYGLEESETTKEVMDIVDAGVKGGAKSDVATPTEKFEAIEPKSRKEGDSGKAGFEHRRQMSRAEEAMDEAMKEARRLTELMIAEDQRLEKERQEKENTETTEATRNSADAVSEQTTPAAPMPTSSQSDSDQLNTKKLSSEGHNEVEDSVTATEQTSSSNTQQFTSFDQIVPRTVPTALNIKDSDKSKQTLTLHNAIVSIFDDSVPGEKASIKAKPNTDYLIQIEPASSTFAGWMVSRKYTDFENLHEVLRRISVITGAGFTEVHAELPKWKTNTKATLRTALEKYLCDAVRFQSLAESEGMKRFLDGDRGLNKSPNGTSKGFGWPTPDAFGKLGGDVMGVLTKAPKQVAGGGKAVIGGVAGLVGANKRQSQSQVSLEKSASTTTLEDAASITHKSQASISQSATGEGDLGSMNLAHKSEDSLKGRSNTLSERRGSNATTTSTESRAKPSASPMRPSSIIGQDQAVEAEATPPGSKVQSPAHRLMMEEAINLPPPPSEMPADYIAPASPSRQSTDTSRSLRSANIDQRLKEVAESEGLPPPTPPRPKPTVNSPATKPKDSLTERETGIAIELIFAIVSQLYTLSSAWQFRRTLLAAAKTFLLRPGNVQLLSIRDLFQTSLLDSNLSDSGLAHHIYKLRANTLPTDEEMEIWRRDFPEKTDEQKDELRVKARKLLVTKGMPQALTSVMGAAASGEALGKVFDCLQIPEVSQGLIHGLILQALRVVTN